MFCSNCGNQIVDSAKFCPICGASTDVIISGPTTPTPQAPAPQPARQQPVPNQAPQTIPFAAQPQQTAQSTKNDLDSPLAIIAGIMLCIAAPIEVITAITNHGFIPLLYVPPFLAAGIICLIKPAWGPKAIAAAQAVDTVLNVILAVRTMFMTAQVSYLPFSYYLGYIFSLLFSISFAVFLALGAFDLLPDRMIAPIGMMVVAAVSVFRTISSYIPMFSYGATLYAVLGILVTLLSYVGYTLACFAFQQNRNAAGKPVGTAA